jgi:uncharacterized membrane protein (UPF0136 family)
MSFHTALTSGVLTLSTGVYGYMKTGSRPSLLGGLSLASAFLSSAFLLKRTDYQVTGHSIAAAAGTLSLILGVKRMNLKTGLRVGPSVLLLVGVLNVPYQYLKVLEWTK